MEKENTYGRKVIRQSPIVKKFNVNMKLFLYSIVIVFIGIMLGWMMNGLFSNQEVTEHEVTPVPTTDPNEFIMFHVNQFGSYDNRILTSEISLDWSAEGDFIPLDCPMDEELQEFVYYLCKGYDIDWTLVMALIQRESDFVADAIGKTDDYGLMQINKCNHEWLSNVLGITDFLDPEQNIRAGVFVLRKLFEGYTDPELVLMCYNMGETGASRLWNKGIYSTKYTEYILKVQAEFKEQLERKEGTE